MRQVSCYGEQNFWLWPVAFDREQTLEIPVSVSYDKEKLKRKDQYIECSDR